MQSVCRAGETERCRGQRHWSNLGATWEQLGTCKLHGAAGCGPWEHHRGFSCRINEILVLPVTFCCAATPASRTRLRLDGCRERALWVPAARLGFGACPGHRTHAFCCSKPAAKRHLWKCHKAQEGEEAPPSQGKSSRALVQRQRVSRAGALFNRAVCAARAEGGGTFPPDVCKAPCVLVMLYKYISNK